MVTWQAAPSVRAALTEADKRWPRRSRRSDGTIGDPAHSSRTSDHNPDSRRIVHAFDLTHDPANGVDCGQLFAHLVARCDPRIRYAIHNRRMLFGPGSSDVIAGRRECWTLVPYNGVNPHTTHLHVSIAYNDKAERDTSPWWELQQPRAAKTAAPAFPLPRGHYFGPKDGPSESVSGYYSHRDDLRRWQQRMRERGWQLDADGLYGDETERVCSAFQTEKRLTVDGLVGAETWAAAWTAQVT